MNLALLQQWLSLPAGGWPPDDRTLLGLPTGPVDAALAEQNALARMETLRPHQLLHPELVTEGMNRLAQALIAVSAPPAPAAPAPSPAFALDDLPDLSAPQTAPIQPQPLPPPAPAVIDYEASDDEVVEAEVVELPPPPPVPPPRPLVQLEADPLVLDDVADTPPPPGATATRTDRRKLYRELAFLRQLRKAWERIGPVAGVPSEPVRSAEAVYLVLVTRRELLRLFDLRPDLTDDLDRGGRVVTAVFTQPHAAAVLRELVPSQRAAVAADWAAGRVGLFARYAGLRKRIRAMRPKRWGVRAAGRMGDFFRRNPEWVLVLLTLLLVLIGLLRTAATPR
ncbi:MAG: hypothetical protein MUF18_18620 [Fimbriiglobus sp.]|jgi:hypothetical protein|nr:hypothetical protein [Fimbriiglobus sp.]